MFSAYLFNILIWTVLCVKNFQWHRSDFKSFLGQSIISGNKKQFSSINAFSIRLILMLPSNLMKLFWICDTQKGPEIV